MQTPDARRRHRSTRNAFRRGAEERWTLFRAFLCAWPCLVFALASGLVVLEVAAAPANAPSPPRVWGMPFGRLPDTARETALAELGRHLFFDPRLSINGCVSCATCHLPERAFTDGRARAVGAFGDAHARNTPTLTNVAYAATFTASNAGIETLEAQVLVPLFNTAPPEMGLTRTSLPDVLSRFDRDAGYRAMLERAYPGERTLTLEGMQQALAAFQRTLVSFESPFDRYTYLGDDAAMPPAARRGMQLFFSRRLACAACHSGWNFSGAVRVVPVPVADDARSRRPAALPPLAAEAPVVQRFHNMGFEIEPAGGAAEFKAPTLRNIALTGPYMHDGRFATLEEVIRHYEDGGGEGSNKSSLLRRFTLTPQERGDLIVFLEQLSDDQFVARGLASKPAGSVAPAIDCASATSRPQGRAAAATDTP